MFCMCPELYQLHVLLCICLAKSSKQQRHRLSQVKAEHTPHCNQPGKLFDTTSGYSYILKNHYLLLYHISKQAEPNYVFLFLNTAPRCPQLKASYMFYTSGGSGSCHHFENVSRGSPFCWPVIQHLHQEEEASGECH